MANSSKLRQIVSLSSSSFLLRAMGMAFRVYLSLRIGAVGMGLNQLIFSVYMLASLPATRGLSDAVLRLCAEHPYSAKSIVGKAVWLCACFSTVLGLFLFLGAAPLSHGPLTPQALLPLRLLAPSIPISGVSACLRGYFLSRSEAPRAALCQFIEQSFRISLSILLLESNREADLQTLCSLQMASTTAGELVSLLCHLAFFHRSPRDTQSASPSILPELLRIALPILLAALVQSGMQTAENLLIPPLLRASGSSAALEEYGLLSGMVLPVLFFPAAIPSAILTVQLPAAIRLTAKGHTEALRQHLKKSLNVCLGFSMLCTALFCGLSDPLMRTLYRSTDAASLLFLLSPLLPLLYLDRLADGLLISLERQKATLLVELADSSLRLCLLLLLAPRLGLRGLILMMALSAFFACSLRMKCLFNACGCRRNYFLRGLVGASPSLIGGLGALLAGLCISALPLSPWSGGLLGLLTGTLSFFLLYSLSALLVHKYTGREIHRFQHQKPSRL